MREFIKQTKSNYRETNVFVFQRETTRNSCIFILIYINTSKDGGKRYLQKSKWKSKDFME